MRHHLRVPWAIILARARCEGTRLPGPRGGARRAETGGAGLVPEDLQRAGPGGAAALPGAIHLLRSRARDQGFAQGSAK